MRQIEMHLIIFTVILGFAQKTASPVARELINIKNFRIIDNTKRNPKDLEMARFAEVIKDDWKKEVYNNEYDGVEETRLYKGKSYLHKEALEQNYLGNSAILDDSIILLDEQGLKFYVGMPISTVKKKYPVSYSLSRKLNNNENKNLRQMFLLSTLVINGQVVVTDGTGVSIIYNNDSGKVERIYTVE